MILNIKKFFKKIACFGGAAFMAFSLCSPLVKAAAPGANDVGILYSDSGITINKATLTLGNKYEIRLNTSESDLIYNGSAKPIISSANLITNAEADGTTLYLRVDTSTESKSSESEWVAVAGANAPTSDNPLANSSLTKTAHGTYYVYYYIDGGNNYNDLAAQATEVGG